MAARTVQGIGAPLAVPATLALIGTMYPPGRARTRALGVLAAMTSAGVISGVLLGGLVTEVAGWRWVFLPEGRAEGAAGPPDLAGGLLGSAAVMLLVYALIRLEAPGRGLVSAALSGGAGLVLLAGFVAWERRAPAPLLRPGILSIRSLRGATLGAAANSGSFTAVVFVGTLYLQTGLYATVIALVAGEGAVGPEALARGYGAAFLAAAGLAVLEAAGAWQLHGHPADRGG